MPPRHVVHRFPERFDAGAVVKPLQRHARFARAGHVIGARITKGEAEEPHARERIGDGIADQVHLRALRGAGQIQKLDPVADRT